MSYDNSYNERQEAYEAGRQGRSIHTAHADEYQRGVRSRKAAQAAREGPGILGVLGIVMLVAMIVFIVAVIASALMALVGAVVAWLMARAWAPGSRVTYASAYKACLLATFAWLAVTGTLGIAAMGWSDDAPRMILSLVRSLSWHFQWACQQLIGPFAPMLPPEVLRGLQKLPSGVSAAAAAPMREVAIALLVAPAALLSAALLSAAGPPYLGWLGYVRSCITLPLIIAAELPVLLLLAAVVIRYTWNL